MKGLHKPSVSALVLLLAASLVACSWSAPQAHFQRRNWTPQAMLYLKGAQGRRFIADESQRKDLYDRVQLEARSHNTNPLSLPEAAALFLASLQKAQEGRKLKQSFTNIMKQNRPSALLDRLNKDLEMSFLEKHEKFFTHKLEKREIAL